MKNWVQAVAIMQLLVLCFVVCEKIYVFLPAGDIDLNGRRSKNEKAFAWNGTMNAIIEGEAISQYSDYINYRGMM